MHFAIWKKDACDPPLMVYNNLLLKEGNLFYYIESILATTLLL